MGYHVDIEVDGAVIPAKKVADCLKAVNAMWGPDGKPSQTAGGGSYLVGGKGKSDCWYSWTRNPPPGGFPTLVEALDSWRYKAEVVENGDVIITGFEGEKWGDDEMLYKVLAPFLGAGAQVICDGEDGEKWKYVFMAGKMTQKTWVGRWR